MKKYNVFAEGDLAERKVAEVFDYPISKEKRLNHFTMDIYTQAFFYLTKRFGEAKVYDDYKDGGVWEFNVKQFKIEVYLNSCWVSFYIYGDKNWKMLMSPYWTKYNREYLKKKHHMVDLHKDGWTDEEKPIVHKLYSEFLVSNSIVESETTQEEWNKKYSMNWYKRLKSYNDEVIGLNYKEITEKYGTTYQNSYTRLALRTLEQFLRNMLTPIYVRDVPYNIKGRITDKQAYDFGRHTDNIKIEFIP